MSLHEVEFLVFPVDPNHAKDSGAKHKQHGTRKQIVLYGTLPVNVLHLNPHLFYH